MRRSICSTYLSVAAFVAGIWAYELDTSDRSSAKSIAKDVATDLMNLYPGNKPGGTPGLLHLPYYWWEGGAMLGTMIDYWYYTGDDSWNDDISIGLLTQVGDYNDYMPASQVHTEGNDDQGFWGLAVMTASEFNFPNPPDDKPQWLALAQAVFNTQAARWDTEHCDGGLRWQIFTWNNGYDYKNTISQACFFALGARLARYTGNDTYLDWARKTWDWTVERGYIDDQYRVFDGAYIDDGCKELTPYRWTYNIGAFILGVSALYNHTEDVFWKNHLDGLINGTRVFFTGDENNIMTEVTCEPVDRCNIDQQSFKAYFSRWLTNAMVWAPYLRETLEPLLEASSVAAAAQCKGGDNGRMCGMKWNTGKYDGTTGIGQQMAVLEAVLSNLVDDKAPPVTEDKGGTSKGDASAGGSDIGRTEPRPLPPLRGGNTVGAAFLTMALLAAMFALVVFLFIDETPDTSMKDRWNWIRSTVATGGLAALFANHYQSKPVLELRQSQQGPMSATANEKSAAAAGGIFSSEVSSDSSVRGGVPDEKSEGHRSSDASGVTDTDGPVRDTTNLPTVPPPVASTPNTTTTQEAPREAPIPGRLHKRSSSAAGQIPRWESVQQSGRPQSNRLSRYRQP